MSINIEYILLEISQLPEYKEQLSLQISENGEGAEGKLLELNHKEKDFNKLSEEDLDNENYLVVKSRTTKFFHFGNYKTKKSQGIKTIPVGKVLNSVLNIWLKFNNEPFLLVDSQSKPMSSNQLSKYINYCCVPFLQDP